MKRNNKSRASVVDLIEEDFAPLEAKTEPLPPSQASIKQSPHHDFSRQDDVLINVNPEKCSPWKFADRTDEELGDIDALALSIAHDGQQEPILIRPAKDAATQYEIIFGNRRWRACQKIGKPIKAILRTLSDQEAAISQKAENENRVDISDYAKAKYYEQLLTAKVFSSQSELAKRMGIGHSTLVDIMSYIRIPDAVLCKFNAPHKIPRSHAAKLAAIASRQKNHSKLAKKVENIAKDIEQKKISLKKLEQSLSDALEGKPESQDITRPMVKKTGPGRYEIWISKDIEENHQNLQSQIEGFIFNKFYRTAG